jgi:hypothetical protein
MKLRDGKANTYYCEWCKTTFDKIVGEYVSIDKFSKGKQNVTSQCVCPNCGRTISQKKVLK